MRTECFDGGGLIKYICAKRLPIHTAEHQANFTLPVSATLRAINSIFRALNCTRNARKDGEEELFEPLTVQGFAKSRTFPETKSTQRFLEQMPWEPLTDFTHNVPKIKPKKLQHIVCLFLVFRCRVQNKQNASPPFIYKKKRINFHSKKKERTLGVLVYFLSLDCFSNRLCCVATQQQKRQNVTKLRTFPSSFEGTHLHWYL